MNDRALLCGCEAANTAIRDQAIRRNRRSEQTVIINMGHS